ncbi:hypothetical protein HU200_057788 [Digitaria exilis]|uniref:Crossover junction endonuclease EME1 n=1 Tax=Digitaria exilis TaxID=1010633 RepID=A0A835AAI8_9POAL|nr:hypothetical protein HU200_057788 [Digitaria exilis]
MASSQIPFVNILDDDDLPSPAVFASPPSSSSRKRSHGSAGSTSQSDFLDAFSPSPPLQKRLLLALGDPVVLDDTPSPPKRRPSSAPEPPVLVLDDDDYDPSASGGVASGGVVTVTPDSVLHRAAFSQTPEMAMPSSASLGTVVPETPGGTVVPETPGFPSLRSVGPVPAKNLSGKPSLISLESDDEDDDTIYKNYLKSSVGCGTTQSEKNPEMNKRQEKDDAQQIEAKERKQPAKKRLTKEEKAKMLDERKQKQQEDKLQKQAMRAQQAVKKKNDKEIQKWESGKYALKCITAEIDHNVAESGSIGGCLLSSLSEKCLSYKLTNNPVKGSILWKMNVPPDVAQAFSSLHDDCDMDPASLSKVQYIAIVLQAEEFCDLVSKGLFFNHVQEIRKKHSEFSICYVINKLTNHINKCEQSQYKNNLNTWKRPPVEEVLSKLATHYTNVHSRQCIDEAEVAEHIVGLTSNLAKCKFRKPLTWLSVHANGAIISKDFVDKNLAKKDTWLKALIAIPDIQPRYAMAIKKKYPCMRSLLNEYMDPSKTVQEKEDLLSDLKWDNRLGEEGKRLGKKCSRRVYRMLMTQNGDLYTDDPEAGGSA